VNENTEFVQEIPELKVLVEAKLDRRRNKKPKNKQ
jgi:hypothetical protein